MEWEREHDRRIRVPRDAAGAFMQKYIGRAVMELRRRKDWDQTELARAFDRRGFQAGLQPPDRRTISQWENGRHRPSPDHQSALSKIARAHKETFLHDIFSAPPYAWTLVVAIVEVGILIDPADPEQLRAAIEEYRHSDRGVQFGDRSLPG